MKKSLIVTIAVSVLLAGSAVAAAGTSLVGKKVAKEVQVEVDGKKTKNPAVIIDGVTYAPVREVGEITGRTVKYEKGVVVMKSVGEPQETVSKHEPSPNDLVSIDTSLAAKREEITNNEERIKGIEAATKRTIERFDYFNSQGQGTKYEDSDAYKEDLKTIEDLKGKNETLTKEIAELERQKAELSAKK